MVSSPQAKKFFPARCIFAEGKNAAGSINQQKLAAQKLISNNYSVITLKNLTLQKHFTMAKAQKETPLMTQYNSIKAKYPDAMLLFRVGDFYETFGQDAIKASKILGIVLTKRANGAASSIELAGFPHHSLETYLPKLVKAGLRVAICDQLEDPKTVKGIVKRGVTELITPGVSYNDQVLNAKQNNYLMAIHQDKGLYGMALVDVSTGEFWVSEGNLQHFLHLL